MLVSLQARMYDVQSKQRQVDSYAAFPSQGTVAKAFPVHFQQLREVFLEI
jgi:hypothetical protein